MPKLVNDTTLKSCSMRQFTRIVGLLFLLIQFACTPKKASEGSPQISASTPLNLGIFEYQNTERSAFQYDTLTGNYYLPSSTDGGLRFISIPIQSDFILETKMPNTSPSESTFGLLLSSDQAGDYPVAALQVVDGKLLFSPDTRIGGTNALALKADYIRLEYINQQAAAYYIIDEDIRPIAIQQMEDEAQLFVGLFARSTSSDLTFESVELSYPDISPALSGH